MDEGADATNQSTKQGSNDVGPQVVRIMVSWIAVGASGRGCFAKLRHLQDDIANGKDWVAAKRSIVHQADEHHLIDKNDSKDGDDGIVGYLGILTPKQTEGESTDWGDD